MIKPELKSTDKGSSWIPAAFNQERSIIYGGIELKNAPILYPY